MYVRSNVIAWLFSQNTYSSCRVKQTFLLRIPSSRRLYSSRESRPRKGVAFRPVWSWSSSFSFFFFFPMSTLQVKRRPDSRGLSSGLRWQIQSTNEKKRKNEKGLREKAIIDGRFYSLVIVIPRTEEKLQKGKKATFCLFIFQIFFVYQLGSCDLHTV